MKFSVPPFVELATCVSRIVPDVVAFAPVLSVNVNVSAPVIGAPFNVLITWTFASLVFVYVHVGASPAVSVTLTVLSPTSNPAVAPWANPAP